MDSIRYAAVSSADRRGETMAGESVEYREGKLSAEELRQELRAFFESAAEDKGARADAEETGTDLDELLGGGADQIEVEPAGAGFTGVEEAILIKLATLAAQRAWDKVFVPWLERRRGKDPLGRLAGGDEGESTPD
jgi:hypothetical protein